MTKLPQGHPRRAGDARCAWKGMDAMQRREFLIWITLAERDDLVVNAWNDPCDRVLSAYQFIRRGVPARKEGTK